MTKNNPFETFSKGEILLLPAKKELIDEKNTAWNIAQTKKQHKTAKNTLRIKTFRHFRRGWETKDGQS